MNVLWISEDRAEIRKVMASWESDGHLVAHPRRPFTEPDHTPQGQPPAVFTAWTMARYQQVAAGYFDGDSGPERVGVVRVLFWLQPGRGGAVLDGAGGLYQALLTKFDQYDTHLCFLPPIPVDETERLGAGGSGPWWVEGVEIPFKVA